MSEGNDQALEVLSMSPFINGRRFPVAAWPAISFTADSYCNAKVFSVVPLTTYPSPNFPISYKPDNPPSGPAMGISKVWS